MALSRVITGVGVLFVSLAAALGTGELGLRLLGRPPDPVEFQRRNDPTGWDSDGVGRLPVAFDPDLLWRRARSEEPLAAARSEYLLLVLADGSACDPRWFPHWPQRLERLLDFNETARPVRIVNAAEPGYSSFQARRKLDRFAGRPDLVVVGLGDNDAHRVRLSDADYARRVAGLGWLARSWLVLHLAHRLWTFADSEPDVPRVAPQETRANLDSIAARVRHWGGEVVLQAAPVVAGEVAPRLERIRIDPGARSSSEAISMAVLDFLVVRSLVLTRHRFPAQADLGIGDGWPELIGGFGPAEDGAQGLPGRWAEAEASFVLERRAGEGGIAIELSCPGLAEGTVEANGVAVGGFGGCLARRWYRFSLEAIEDDRVRVRLVSRGARQLFVHGVTLTPSADPVEHAAQPLYASELELDVAGDERPELGAGWWPREVWADGRRGRWTSREASLYLERRDAEKGLLLEATLQNPDDTTSCRIEVNGVPVYSFTSANGRHRYGVDIERVPGRRLRVRLIAERTFVPATGGDRRSLGLFVHSVRLARSAIP